MLYAYTRVSTIEQAQDNRTSLKQQERQLRGYAAARDVPPDQIHVFSDPGISGAVSLCLRPGGAQMLAQLKTGDLVVAAKIDRAFRDVLDALTTAKDFRERGIHLAFLDFMGGEPVTGKGMAQCFFTMATAFAQLEKDRIAERMREGKQAKLAKGGHTGGVAPYGFTIVGSGREARLEPNPAEQETIQLAIRLKQKLGGLGPATRELVRRGCVDRAGSPFRYGQVQRWVQRTEARQ